MPNVASGSLVSGLLIMLDADTPAIVLGPGGHRSCDSVQLTAGGQPVGTVEKLVFHPISGVAVAWWYKTEWYISSEADLVQTYPRETWQLGWTAAAAFAVGARERYVDR